jgi:hypothetical protein
MVTSTCLQLAVEWRRRSLCLLYKVLALHQPIYQLTYIQLCNDDISSLIYFLLPVLLPECPHDFGSELLLLVNLLVQFDPRLDNPVEKNKNKNILTTLTRRRKFINERRR